MMYHLLAAASRKPSCWSRSIRDGDAWPAPREAVGPLSVSRVRPRVGPWLRGVALAASLLVAAAFSVPGSLAASEPERHRQYRDMALLTQQHTWAVLGYSGGASDCASAPYVTYRRDTLNVSISDHWYVALQLRADAALVRLGEGRFRCQVDKTAAWMGRLWDPKKAGFAPRADLDGGNPMLQVLYADDNALIGLAFLEAARVTHDPAARERALAWAEMAAQFLLKSGLWDDTFGGGLWWNTLHESAPEGKPAQTAALMAQLMAELHAETGRPQYRREALATLEWLDRTLWDGTRGLYAYGVHHTADPQVMEIDGRYFGYDQAIAIQALLRLHRTEPNREYLGRAQDLGRAMVREFWHGELGGYTLEAGGVDVWVPYAAWVSEGLLDLYAADGDPFWRERARENLDALHRTFANRETGGYSLHAFPCNVDTQVWCRPGERWGLDRRTYTVAQAPMQRAAALQAAAYDPGGQQAVASGQ